MPLPPPDSLIPYAIVQWRREPATRIEDAYKWLFHATQGGDHAVGDDDAGPRRWMDREWIGLGTPRTREPELVRLDPEGKIVRINLRPYRARGGDREMLLAVFVASARQFRPDRRTFVRAWNDLGRRLRQGRVGKLTYPEWVRLDRENRPLGFPAIHHSPTYESTHRPAYRVVLRSLWPVGTTIR
ncbi:MAG: hypothetical protein ACO1SV_10985 [Fimbriimonas sp.]